MSLAAEKVAGVVAPEYPYPPTSPRPHIGSGLCTLSCLERPSGRGRRNAIHLTKRRLFPPPEPSQPLTRLGSAQRWWPLSSPLRLLPCTPTVSSPAVGAHSPAQCRHSAVCLRLPSRGGASTQNNVGQTTRPAVQAESTPPLHSPCSDFQEELTAVLP